MNVLDVARKAVGAIADGRKALADIADSVKDGTVILSTTDRAELEQLLDQERAESIAAHDALASAIAEQRK